LLKTYAAEGRGGEDALSSSHVKLLMPEECRDFKESPGLARLWVFIEVSSDDDLLPLEVLQRSESKRIAEDN